MPAPPSLSGDLIAAEAVVLGLTLAAGWLAGSALRSRDGEPSYGRAALGVALLGFGLRLGLGAGQVSWAPYLDQWYAIWGDLLSPLVHGTLHGLDLAAANNEHRIVLTRALDLGVAIVNGEWDNRVLVLAMFALQAASAGVAALFAWRRLGGTRGSLVAATAVLPLALDCNWENLVSGFQTQFGFLVLGTVLAIGLLARRSPPWTAAAAALVLGLLLLGSMASGLLTAVVVGLGAAFAWRRGDWPTPTAAPILAGAAALAVLGWWARPAFSLPALQAHGAGEFYRALLAYGSWPFPPALPALLLLWAPWIVLAARPLTGRPVPPGSSFSAGLGLWVLLQVGALAYSRAGLSGLVSSRYTEILQWAAYANAVAFGLLLPPAGRRRQIWTGALVVWLTLAAGAQVWRSGSVYRPYFTAFRLQTREQEERLVTVARTGRDQAVAAAVFPQVPAPPEVILPILHDRAVRPLFPAPLRQAFPDQAGISGGWLSFLAVRLLRTGPAWQGAGALLLVSAWLSARARNFARKT